MGLKNGWQTKTRYENHLIKLQSGSLEDYYNEDKEYLDKIAKAYGLLWAKISMN